VRRSCLALLFVLSVVVAAAEEPLRLEDVVRMHVQGVSTPKIVEKIRRSAVDFDLSGEMLEELRIAGVPETVVEAMIERQHELHPPAPAALPEGPAEAEPAEPEAGPRLRIRIQVPGAKGDAPARLKVPEQLPPQLLARLGVEPDARIANVALWVACLTATHVPDHWRSESPLGRDFASMPRHRLLAFEPGAEPSKDGTLVLELPDVIDVAFGDDGARSPDTEHELSLGIALDIGGRWVRVTSAERNGVARDTTELTLELVPYEADPSATKLTWR
jgi:hypothetical protein